MTRAYFYLANRGRGSDYYICGALVGGYREVDRSLLERYLEPINGSYPIREYNSFQEMCKHLIEDVGSVHVSTSWHDLHKLIQQGI